MGKVLEKLVLVLPNIACFVVGSVHGSLEARIIPIDTSQYCFWLANITGTSIGKTLLTKKEESYLDNAGKGILMGTIAAPLEYTLGYALGYSTNYIVERLFNN